jgi:predicted dehydrogenase
MRALVVGYGSIGARHARILEELGCQVAVVSAREVPVARRFDSIAAALRGFAPDYAVVASGTARHPEEIAQLAAGGFTGTLLVEKPLCHKVCDLAPARFAGSFVAYNLRCHPMIVRLRELLATEKILSVQAYVGQYLPLWRPGRDYRTVYSADKSAGGGVLRDLSHELDLLNWLLGGWRSLTALGGHWSHLEIDSDDVFSILMTTARCPAVSLQMNYLDRMGRRRLTVNSDLHTFEVDFGAGRLTVDGEGETFQVERDESYRAMHRALLQGRHGELCSFAEGYDVVRMIAAAELAVKEGRWIAP